MHKIGPVLQRLGGVAASALKMPPSTTRPGERAGGDRPLSSWTAALHALAEHHYKIAGSAPPPILLARLARFVAEGSARRDGPVQAWQVDHLARMFGFRRLPETHVRKPSELMDVTERAQSLLSAARYWQDNGAGEAEPYNSIPSTITRSFCRDGAYIVQSNAASNRGEIVSGLAPLDHLAVGECNKVLAMPRAPGVTNVAVVCGLHPKALALLSIGAAPSEWSGVTPAARIVLVDRDRGTTDKVMDELGRLGFALVTEPGKHVFQKGAVEVLVENGELSAVLEAMHIDAGPVIATLVDCNAAMVHGHDKAQLLSLIRSNLKDGATASIAVRIADAEQLVDAFSSADRVTGLFAALAMPPQATARDMANVLSAEGTVLDLVAISRGGCTGGLERATVRIADAKAVAALNSGSRAFT